MVLFIFFALPLATILLSIVLQRILKFPILVAITFFAIFLTTAFIVSILEVTDLGTALVAAIIYTIIAFITAVLVKLICKILKKIERICRNENDSNESDVEAENEDNNNNCCHCNCRQNDDIAVQGVIEVQNNNNNGGNNNNCLNNQVDVRASVLPNASNQGRTGTFRGCYRRR